MEKEGNIAESLGKIRKSISLKSKDDVYTTQLVVTNVIIQNVWEPCELMEYSLFMLTYTLT